MTTRSRDADIHAKQEGNTNDFKLTKAPSSSRQWSAFRNPRIVRVSRSFGGKDRHSKVCTIRGLRDRRIRLSVPTAIQLYELQDRLGLSQPSKVIDWLLDATKLDIDKLPPLQMPQGNFGQFLQPMASHHDLSSSQPSYAPFFHPNSSFLKSGWANSMLSSREGVEINDNDDEDGQQMSSGKSKYWEVEGSRAKGKEVSREFLAEKTKWMYIEEQGNRNSEGIEGYNNAPMLSAQQFFPASNSNSLPAGLMNNSMSYNSSFPYQNWDPSNLSLAQFGSQGLLSSMENPHNYGNVSSSSSITGSQLFLCPPTMLAPPAMIPSYPSYFSTPVEMDAGRENANNFQHSLMLPHQPNYPKLFLHSQSNDESPTNDSTSS